MSTDLRTRLQPTDLRVLHVDVVTGISVASAPVTVYDDPHLGRRLAGKVLQPPPEVLEDPAATTKWYATDLLEGRLQQSLRDDDHVLDVVTVQEVHDEHGRPTGAVEILTPFMELGSLFDHWYEGGRLDAREAVAVVRDAALGLAAVHDLGYVHRDVKTPNVFLCRRPDRLHGLIGDLGHAAALGVDGIAEGHPQPNPWIAPEQMDPKRTASVVTDLFGLGACLVDVLRPSLLDGWNQQRRLEAAKRMTEGHLPLPLRRYAPPPWAPPRVRRLIRSLTKPHPADRSPRTARDVADALSTPVPPWRCTDSTADVFRFEANGSVRVAVAGHRMRRKDQWQVRAVADRGRGERSVLSGRIPGQYRDTDLKGYFDAALTAWSR